MVEYALLLQIPVNVPQTHYLQMTVLWMILSLIHIKYLKKIFILDLLFLEIKPLLLL
jgi:hypothetical protein